MKYWPTFFIIGAMKCGTSSLHHYLNMHPDISMSEIKEPNYFAKHRTFLHKGKNWYLNLFDQDKPIRGESSTAYTKFPQVVGVPKRIFKRCPEAKLVYLVRDPIERTLSHISHDMLEGLIPYQNDISAYINSKPDNPYIAWSMYYLQLSQYIEYFDKNQICIIRTEDLSTNPQHVLSRLLNFLNLRNNNFHFDVSDQKNVSGNRKMIENRNVYQKVKRKKGLGEAEKLRIDFEKPLVSDENHTFLVQCFKQDQKLLNSTFSTCFK